MSGFTKLLKSRIGTCRSGTKLDVPHDLTVDAIPEFLDQFSIDDRVDLFCMTEALIAHQSRSNLEDESYTSVYKLSHFIWTSKNNGIEEIRPRLAQLGLFTSPSYVQFGQKMLV